MIKLTFNQLEAIYMLAKAQSKGSEWELTAEVQLYAPFADKLSSAYLNNSLLYTPKYFEPIKIDKPLKGLPTGYHYVDGKPVLVGDIIQIEDTEDGIKITKCDL